MNDIIRIGTRKSALALIQTQLVADELRQVCPGIQVEIVTKDTPVSYTHLTLPTKA